MMSSCLFSLTWASFLMSYCSYSYFHPSGLINIILGVSITKYGPSGSFCTLSTLILDAASSLLHSNWLFLGSGFATRTDYHLVLQLGEMRIRRQYFVEYKFCENRTMWSSDNKCGSCCKHHCDTWYEFMALIDMGNSIFFPKRCGQADLKRLIFFRTQLNKNVKTKSEGWLPESASSRDSERGHFRWDVLWVLSLGRYQGHSPVWETLQTSLWSVRSSPKIWTLLTF